MTRLGVNIDHVATLRQARGGGGPGPTAGANARGTVPERRAELTTEGGLDVIKHKDTLKKVIARLHKNDIDVSIFIDPDTKQIEAAGDIGATIIEIHTGRYANASSLKEEETEKEEILNAVMFAKGIGLSVSAGHGLNYRNVRDIAGIKEIEELNIGHSIISRAVLVGLEKAVREMKMLMLTPPSFF